MTGPTGDVGSGRQFGVDLHKLYLAGRVYLPEFADVYGEATEGLHGTGPLFAAARSAVPDLVGLAMLDELRAVLQVAMGRTSVAAHEAGLALTGIAEDYARSDDAARQAFDDLNARNKGVLDEAPPPGSYTPPPGPGGPR